MIRELTGDEAEAPEGTVLRLRKLWGAPKDWAFTEDDEAALEVLLRALDEFEAEASSGPAVLFAEKDGKLLTAWTRGGASRLASSIVRHSTSDAWVEVRRALSYAVTSG